MTVESATVPHVNIVVPNGDASNGNVIPSSKKSRESDRRRRRRKQKKNNKASRADAEEADVSGASDSKENADPQPQVEIEYVAEQPELEDGFSDEFKQIFEKFSFKELVASEDDAKKDESEENKDVKKKVNSDSEDEEDQGNEQKEKGISNKQKKLERRMKIAELKQVSARPDVVEVWDATSADPKLLVFLKSYRNTVPVPRHWSQKRKYLQGKRGIEKAPFHLPDFIAATGIQKIRQAYIEKEDGKKLKQKQRERMQPKMGKMDIDYQVLHDAFFKYQTKPKLSALGDLYFEGKEFEVKLRETKPGTLSHGLKEALGMGEGAPPPWLINMQRYGPPPSYPHLKIPYVSFGKDESSSENKLTNELPFDPSSPWNPLSSEKAAPWWRTTDKDELASLVAQRSLDFVENCDLPTPQKMNRSYYGSPRSFDSDAFRDHSIPNQTTHAPRRGNSFKNRTEEASSESDLSKSKLLEALRRSQTRAREAENMAKEACAEREHLVKLLLKQASELFGYKQLLQLLQLESLYHQIKSKKIEDSKEPPPVSIPWSNTKGRKAGRKRRSKRSKPNGFVGLALGMSLVGAGLLLGWTVGWMQMLSF